MALEYIEAQGGADATVYLVMEDGSGNPDTGLAAADVTAHYLRPRDASPTSISLSDLGSVDATHTEGGWIEVDSTNMPGLYRLDLPDAALARAADYVVVTVSGTTRTYGVLNLDPGAATVQGTVNDASATATSFVTDLAGGSDDIYVGMFLLLPDRPEVSPVTDWVDSSKTITVEALSSAPADNDPIVLIHNP